MAATLREKQEFLRILDNITDTRTRYFFLMMGEAIAEALNRAAPVEPTDTVYLEDIQRRAG